MGRAMDLVWWHWVILGLVLIATELLIPAFYLIWFGLGALVMALLAGLFSPPFAVQITLWAIASGGMVGIWMKFFRNPDRTGAGQSKEGALGVVGLVTRPVGEMGQGEILFQRPVLGADRWPAVADRPIASGDKARVVDVLGQTLKIESVASVDTHMKSARVESAKADGHN
jgi:membrane protein implicated in regulation of membrane protease activity